MRPIQYWWESIADGYGGENVGGSNAPVGRWEAYGGYNIEEEPYDFVYAPARAYVIRGADNKFFNASFPIADDTGLEGSAFRPKASLRGKLPDIFWWAQPYDGPLPGPGYDDLGEGCIGGPNSGCVGPDILGLHTGVTQLQSRGKKPDELPVGVPMSGWEEDALVWITRSQRASFPEPMGRCCSTNGTCRQTTEHWCSCYSSAGSVWTEGEGCLGDPCFKQEPPTKDGCCDPDANNYEEDACNNGDVTPCSDDNGDGKPDCCTYDTGCTDEDADNYDPSATEDDGSCLYSGACCKQCDQTDADGNAVPGKCEEIQGTSFFDMLTKCSSEDGQFTNIGRKCRDNPCPSCPEPIYGCTEEGACNYDSNANEDDGSCIYCPDAGCGTPVCCDDTAENYDSSGDDEEVCCGGECIYSVEGCTDNAACNYNEKATDDDGSCKYPGCKNADLGGDPNNAGCNCDEGSDICCEGYYGCTDSSACNYDENAVEDDGSCQPEGCPNPAKGGSPDNFGCGCIQGAESCCDDGGPEPPAQIFVCCDSSANNYQVFPPCNYTDGTTTYVPCPGNACCTYDPEPYTYFGGGAAESQNQRSIYGKELPFNYGNDVSGFKPVRPRDAGLGRRVSSSFFKDNYENYNSYEVNYSFYLARKIVNGKCVTMNCPEIEGVDNYCRALEDCE